MNLFLEAGDSEFVLGDEFVSVLDGIDLHGGEAIVGELQEFYFGVGFIQSYLVEQLFQGLSGRLPVLDPLIIKGLVVFVKLGSYLPGVV